MKAPADYEGSTGEGEEQAEDEKKDDNEDEEEDDENIDLSRLRKAFNATVIEEKLAIYVREDGTVDVEKAVETGREVVRFSAELWERFLFFMYNFRDVRIILNNLHDF